MVVRTGVTACECSELILDVERLNEVHVLAAHELEDVCDQTRSYIGLRNEYAHVLVEPLRIESSSAACHPECSLVDVVIYIAVDVVLLSELLDSECRLHAADELVIFHIAHHLVFAREFVCICLHLLFGEVVDLCTIVAVRKIVDLRTDLGEQVVVVEICAPHGLVHVGHQTHIGVAEDSTCPCGICICAELLGNLLSCTHDGLHVLARHPLDAS